MGLGVGIAIFDGCEELDFVGPWEVLAFWAKSWPEDDVNVFTVARTDQVVTCAKGLRVLPDHTWESAPPIDVLVYPGGRGTRAQMTDLAIREWITEIRSGASLMTSVCTGSLVYASVGMLKGRRATTHWANFDELLAIDPTIIPDRESRFVDDDDVITSAGVSAGIDMALHLVSRLHSRERAQAVRKGIQYDPEPPV